MSKPLYHRILLFFRFIHFKSSTFWTNSKDHVRYQIKRNLNHKLKVVSRFRNFKILERQYSYTAPKVWKISKFHAVYQIKKHFNEKMCIRDRYTITGYTPISKCLSHLIIYRVAEFQSPTAVRMLTELY